MDGELALMAKQQSVTPDEEPRSEVEVEDSEDD